MKKKRIQKKSMIKDKPETNKFRMKEFKTYDCKLDKEVTQR